MYIASGDPFDKAGAYGIQSGGALFVEEIEAIIIRLWACLYLPLTRHLRTLGVI